MEYKELLLGCGTNKEKKLAKFGDGKEWKNLTTLDEDPNVNPDVIFDLNDIHYSWTELPFLNNSFDELHAYDVLEHVGQQGNYRQFFNEFFEYWRVLKPDGYFFIIVPNYTSVWAFGDPGHTRTFSLGTFAFLDQELYTQEVGKGPMTDYRHVWQGNFKRIVVEESEDKERLYVVLQAKK